MLKSKDGAAEPKKGSSIWKRLARGSGSTESQRRASVVSPPAGATFNEFQEAAADAWGDEADDGLSKLEYHRTNSSPSVPASSSKSSSAGSGRASAASSRSTSPTKASTGRSGVSLTSPHKRDRGGASSRKGLGRQGSAGSMGRQQSQGSLGGASLDSEGVAGGEGAAKALGARIAKFKALIESPKLDMAALRELSWNGIPAEVRPDVWRLLSGYLPANSDRRQVTLERKRAEYNDFVQQYYKTKGSDTDALTHQIQIDIKRTNTGMPEFHNDETHAMFERILFIWAFRHPSSGYVQGINDLVTPFVTVFLSAYTKDARAGADDGTGAGPVCDASVVPEDVRQVVEADSYWCLSKLLDGIQDNYTAAQPGIQKRIMEMKDLMVRVDKALDDHLSSNSIDYLQFAFRWMNCLLMRELPLRCTIRLWDTYNAQTDGFASFHSYVCVAFLTTFSKDLLTIAEFQDLIMFLQKLPTKDWDEKEVALLLAEAYRLEFTFHDAKNHLQ